MMQSRRKPIAVEISQPTTKYLTDRQVAEMTGIALQTLRNYRQLCKGPPYIKLDKSVRYDEADVIEWMDSHRVLPLLGSRTGGAR